MMEIEYVDEEFNEQVLEDIEELPLKGTCSSRTQPTIGIFNLDLIEKSRPPPRTFERREPKERRKPKKYTGKLTKHPSNLVFGTYEDQLAYSIEWNKIHGKY
jgi:hypothetical protein